MIGAHEVAAALGEHDRMKWATELELHECIADALTRAGIAFEREVILGPTDRIDFLVDGYLGLEVKVAGSTADVARQLLRYTHHEQITDLLLVTTKAAHASLPRQIGRLSVWVYTIQAGAF